MSYQPQPEKQNSSDSQNLYQRTKLMISSLSKISKKGHLWEIYLVASQQSTLLGYFGFSEIYTEKNSSQQNYFSGIMDENHTVLGRFTTGISTIDNLCRKMEKELTDNIAPFLFGSNEIKSNDSTINRINPFLYIRNNQLSYQNLAKILTAHTDYIQNSETKTETEIKTSVPVPEKTTANGISTTSIKQQKIALTLKITPQINKVTRFIKLKIDQKVDDFSSRALPSGVASQGVGINTRSMVTTITVRDRDTIAMGGLMRDKVTDSETKVPLLGDIPVLGWLFKNKKKTVEKVNMLFFSTPKILSSYQVDVAETVKDGLNRRAAHLKEVYGEKIPFGTTAKGLFEKAKKQGKGPLYDEQQTKYYQDLNQESIKSN